MSRARQFHTLAHHRVEVHRDALAGSLLLGTGARLQHLLHRTHEALGIDQHRSVKLAALTFVHFTLLQRFQIETNGGNRSLEFVSNGIDEAVMLLIPANLADQKDRVQDEPGDDGAEKDDAQEDLDAFTPVEDDPAAAHRKSHRREADAEGQEECNRFAPAGNPHRGIVMGQQAGVR